MGALRSFLFNMLFYAWSVIIHLIALPTLAMGPGGTAAVCRLWVRGTFALLAGICDLRHEVRGLDKVPNQPCLIAAKHQSAWDTLVFNILFDGPSLVLKRELLRIPLFGWFVQHMGFIPIDRKGGASALKRMIADSRGALERGQYIIIFPEGTRVAPGDHKPYHPGVAALYSQLGVPVVPVALNSGLFWSRRAFFKRPGCITLEILEPIAPGLPRRAFTAELEHRIESASTRLLAAPRNPA